MGERDILRVKYQGRTFRSSLPRRTPIVQPYALRAPEVIFYLGWSPAIDIWSLGRMVYQPPPPAWLPHVSLTSFPQDVRIRNRLLAFQTSTPKSTLRQYEIREKQNDLKGKETFPDVFQSKYLPLTSSGLPKPCNSGGAPG